MWKTELTIFRPHGLRHRIYTKWEIRKNNRREDWQHIGHVLARRSRHDKNTKIAAFVRNQYYPPSLLSKEVKRHCPLSMLKQFERGKIVDGRAAMCSSIAEHPDVQNRPPAR